MAQSAKEHSMNRFFTSRGEPASIHPALYALVGLLLAIVLIPFAYLVIRAFEKPLPEIMDLLLRSKTLEVLLTTSVLLVLVVVINILFGTFISVGLHFVRLPKTHLLIVACVLPLAIPSYVFTYTWLALVPSLSGILAAAFILVLTTLPYMMLAILVSLRRIDNSFIEVARTLGQSRFQIFFKVILPQIRASISAGALLSGLYVLSDFGAVSLLNVETLTVSIQNMFKSSYDRSAASIISLLLIVASILFIAADEKINDKKAKENVFKRMYTEDSRINNLRLKSIVLACVGIYTSLGVIAPLYVLISRFVSNPNPLDVSGLVTASISTISVSAFGALIALMFSAPLGFLIATHAGRFSKVSESIILIGHALPGVVIGLALVSLGSKLGAIYQSVFLLAFAYALLFLAKAVAAMTFSLQLVPQALKEVATTLGKSKTKVSTTVVFPIALPSIGLGTLLVFLTAMKELPATLMLRPTGMDTLATQIWSYASINRFNDAAPYALLLVVIAAIPTFLLSLPGRDLDSEANESKSKVGSLT
jgi:iron(III) transport system permease protein